eukprot:CAMPEP_0202959320 /NCGR_PEP_ID=MMETSP1396-20130829/3535_1 /ASSEMBLY_ACC=CAM_ASM_000872 /TAXON_ID= /ORGANISM="Pseudokeronopsis sp., Strain Brazil" /LENGTH=96 /DNA_ID=CAMNT_0049677827 /DNA_START=906 /DNA_END=1196 /DNA_ORIENTATION=-
MSLIHGYTAPDKSFYMFGGPITYPNFQTNSKVFRIQGCFFYWLRRDHTNPQDVRLSFYTDFEFGGAIPRRILMNAAPVPFTENLNILLKMCQEATL